MNKVESLKKEKIKKATMDEPVVLPIGTEVSAKYKGAFCEAKIKKIARFVRCKVTPLDGHYSQAMVNEAEIQSGQLKIGQTLSVRLQSGTVVDATLNKVLDQSQYTVVFDDGDVATLKRNSLCLKSGKHFAESDTLDQLPLTNPEHFGNPVSLGRRRTRKNIFSPGDTPLSKRSKVMLPATAGTTSTSSTLASQQPQLASSSSANMPTTSGKNSARELCSDSDSDSEKMSLSSSSIGTASTSNRNKKSNAKDNKDSLQKMTTLWRNLKDSKECWGKVVCLEYADKRGAKNKDSWFPALVISENADKSDLCTVKSFCDDRLYKVSIKDAKEFNKTHIKQMISSGDCSSELKTAIEKSIKYLDNNILPENWSLSPKKIPPKKSVKTESICSNDTGEDEQSNSSSLTSGSRRKLFKKFEETLPEDDDLEDEFTDSNIEIEDDDDEEERKEKLRRQQQQQEARDMFVAQLYKCMDDRGTPINSCPMVNGKELNLYKLHQLVNRLGGPNRVTNKNSWKRIYDKLGLKSDDDHVMDSKSKILSLSSKSDTDDSDESSGSGERLPKSPVSLLKKAYQKYVYPFYDLTRKLGPSTYISSDFSRKASRPSRGERKREEERSQANTTLSNKSVKKQENISNQESAAAPSTSKKPLAIKKADNESETETSAKGSKMNMKIGEDDIKAENTDSQMTAPSLTAETAEFDDDLIGNEQDKHGIESNIRIGDGLKVKYGKGKQLKVYDAKVLKTEYDNSLNEFKYFVHYYGWSSRYDEWIVKSRIVDVLRDKSPRRRTGKVKNKGEPLVGQEEQVDDEHREDAERTSARLHTKSESSATPKQLKPPKNQTSIHKERSNSLSKVKTSVDETKPQRRIRTSSYSEKTSQQQSPRRLDKIKEEDKSAKKNDNKKMDVKEKPSSSKEKKESKDIEKIKDESDSESSSRKKDRKRSREEEKEKISCKKPDRNENAKTKDTINKEDKKKSSDDEKKKPSEEKTKRNESVLESVKKRKEDKKNDNKKSDNEEQQDTDLKKDSKKQKVEENLEKLSKAQETSKNKNSKFEESKGRRKSSAEEVKTGRVKASRLEAVEKPAEVTSQLETETISLKKNEKNNEEPTTDTIPVAVEPSEEAIVPETSLDNEVELSKKVEEFIEDLDASPHSSLVIDEDGDGELKEKGSRTESKEKSSRAEQKEKATRVDMKEKASKVEAKEKIPKTEPIKEPPEKDKNCKKKDVAIIETVKIEETENRVEGKSVEIEESKELEKRVPDLDVLTITKPEQDEPDVDLGYEAINSPTPIGEENLLVCDETMPLSPISNTGDLPEDNIPKPSTESFDQITVSTGGLNLSKNLPETHFNAVPSQSSTNTTESLICNEKLLEDISDDENILDFTKASELMPIEQSLNTINTQKEPTLAFPQISEPQMLVQKQQQPQHQPQPIQQQRQPPQFQLQQQQQMAMNLQYQMNIPPPIQQNHAMPMQAVQQNPVKPTIQPLSTKPPKVIVPSNIASSIMKLVPGKNKAIREEEEEDNKGTLADDEENDDDDNKIDTKKSIKMSKKRDVRNAPSKSSSVSNSPRINRSPDSSIDEENSLEEQDDDDDDEDDDIEDDDEDNEDTGSGDKFDRKSFRKRKRDNVVEDKFKSPVQSPKKRRRGRTRSISGDDKQEGKILSQLSLAISGSSNNANNNNGSSINKEIRTSRRGSARKGQSSPIPSLSDPNNSDDNISQNYEAKPKVLTETIAQLSPIRERPFDYTPWTLLPREKFYLLEPIDTSLSSGKIVEILTDRINICRKSYSELKAKLADAERRKKKLEREEKDRERKAAKELAKAAKDAAEDCSDSDSDSDNVSVSKKAGIKKSSSVDSTAMPTAMNN